MQNRESNAISISFKTHNSLHFTQLQFLTCPSVMRLSHRRWVSLGKLPASLFRFRTSGCRNRTWKGFLSTIQTKRNNSCCLLAFLCHRHPHKKTITCSTHTTPDSGCARQRPQDTGIHTSALKLQSGAFVYALPGAMRLWKIKSKRQEEEGLCKAGKRKKGDHEQWTIVLVRCRGWLDQN